MNQNSHRGWRYLAIATLIFFLGAGAWYFLAPVQQSKQLEQSVSEQFGWAIDYIPPADGVIAPDRLERFIRVREAVQDNCRVFHGILDDVIRIETIESDPSLPASEKVSEGFDSFKSMLSAAPSFLDFMDVRNSTLLAEEMGLGEYIYIYLAAYARQLAAEPQGKYAGQEEAYLSPRSQREFVKILGNQLAALQSSGYDRGAAAGIISGLEAEMAALADGSHASPWPNGAPARTEASLAPFRERLDPLYCEGIVRVEILQKNKGFDLEG